MIWNICRNRGRPAWLAIGLLTALTLAVFVRTLAYGFVEFDDDIYVTANPAIRLGLSAAGVRWAFTTLYAAFWHPLTWLSLLLDYELYGLDGRGYHLTNLALHLGSVWVLFVTLRAATGSVWRSAFAVALFAVHPLHVESVAWIAERKDVLSTFLGLCALAVYGRYARSGRGRAYAGAFGLFLLSLMAKPMLVTMPVLLLAWDHWPLGRTPGLGAGTGAAWRRLLLEKLPFLAVSLVFSVLAVEAQRRSGALSLDPGSWWFRTANACYAYGWYVWKTVWPANLAAFYPWRPVLPSIPVAASFLFLAAVTVAVLAAWRRRPWWLAGWLWYGAALLPVSGLVRVGSHAWADRYTYVPLIGLFWAVAWEAGRWAARSSARRAWARAAAVVLVLGYGAAAWRQAGFWSNTAVLFRRTLALTAPNPMIASNLAAVLHKRGENEEALEWARWAVEWNPDYASARNNLGVILNARGDARSAAEAYARAVALSPDYAEARANLGGVLLLLGDYEAGAAHLERAVALTPGDDKAWSNLGGARFYQGRLAEAEACYRRALAANPAGATAHFNLGVILERAGRPGEAARHFGRAAALRPDDAEIRARLHAARARVSAHEQEAERHDDHAAEQADDAVVPLPEGAAGGQ